MYIENNSLFLCFVRFISLKRRNIKKKILKYIISLDYFSKNVNLEFIDSYALDKTRF